MLGWLKNIFSGFSAGSEQDQFIRIIQVACHDREVKGRLLHLLKAKSIDRSRLIKNMCLIIEKKGGPHDLIQAIGLLQDESLALRTREILEKKWF